MFRTPREIYHFHETVENPLHLPARFGVLSWNVNKRRNIREYQQIFHHLKAEWNLHLFCLQEARFRNSHPFLLEGYHYYGSANLRAQRTHYGVLTASSTRSIQSTARLSEGRELYLATYKPYLVNLFPLSNGETLLCLNIHAINFRENSRYTYELLQIMTFLSTHQGPMIISGDFNSWNPARKRSLNAFCRQLSLKQVPFDGGKIKSFGGHLLDFIFYRNFSLIRYEVKDLPGYSDHNPLLAEFKIGKQ